MKHVCWRVLPNGAFYKGRGGSSMTAVATPLSSGFPSASLHLRLLSSLCFLSRMASHLTSAGSGSPPPLRQEGYHGNGGRLAISALLPSTCRYQAGLLKTKQVGPSPFLVSFSFFCRLLMFYAHECSECMYYVHHLPTWYL